MYLFYSEEPKLKTIRIILIMHNCMKNNIKKMLLC